MCDTWVSSTVTHPCRLPFPARWRCDVFPHQMVLHIKATFSLGSLNRLRDFVTFFALAKTYTGLQRWAVLLAI